MSENPYIFSQIEVRSILDHCIPRNFMARERKKKQTFSINYKEHILYMVIC